MPTVGIKMIIPLLLDVSLVNVLTLHVTSAKLEEDLEFDFILIINE